MVYFAFDEVLQRDVAVKVLNLRPGADYEAFAQRLRREAKTLAKVRHRSVVRVLDLVDEDDILCLVLEYLDGPDLKTFAESPLPTDTVVAIVGALAEGLQTVHDAGILHRDIKPNNIVIVEGPHPVLIDFGLTAWDRSDVVTRDLTLTGAIVGTPGFMAPEVLLGHGHSVQSDIFALAAVCHELLSGRQLIQAAEFNSLLRGHGIPIPVPADLRDDVGPELSDMLVRMLELSPKARPARVAELARVCTAWLARREPPSAAVAAPRSTMGASGDFSPLALVRTSELIPFFRGEQGRRRVLWSLAVAVAFVMVVVALGMPWFGGDGEATAEVAVAVVETGADVVVVQGPDGNSCRVVLAESRRIVGSGTFTRGRFRCGMLRPATNHLVVVENQPSLPFRTANAVVYGHPRAVAQGSILCLDVATNLADSELTVEVPGATPSRRTLVGGRGRVTFTHVTPAADGAVAWILAGPHDAVARGRTYATGPVALPWSLSRRLPVVASWAGSELFIADDTGTVFVIDGTPVSPSGPVGMVLERRRWSLAGAGGSYRSYFLETVDENLMNFIGVTAAGTLEIVSFRTADGGVVTRRTVRLPWRRFDLFHRPLRWGRRTVVQADGDGAPRWLVLDDDGRFLGPVRTVPSAEYAPAAKGPVGGAVYGETDGTQVYEHGWAFLARPVMAVDRLYTLIGRVTTNRHMWIEGRLYSLALGDEGLGAPRFHGRIPSWAGRQCMTVVDEVPRLGGRHCTVPGRKSLVGAVIEEPGLRPIVERRELDAGQGYFAAPVLPAAGGPCSLYCSDLEGAPPVAPHSRRLVDKFHALLNYRSVYLMTWNLDGAATLHTPPLFRLPSPVLGMTGVFWWARTEPAVLVGATMQNLFAVDMATGRFGSIVFDGKLVETVVMADDGFIAVLLQGHCLAMMTSELLLAGDGFALAGQRWQLSHQTTPLSTAANETQAR